MSRALCGRFERSFRIVLPPRLRLVNWPTFLPKQERNLIVDGCTEWNSVGLIRTASQKKHADTVEAIKVAP